MKFYLEEGAFYEAGGQNERKSQEEKKKKNVQEAQNYVPGTNADTVALDSLSNLSGPHWPLLLNRYNNL